MNRATTCIALVSASLVATAGAGAAAADPSKVKKRCFPRGSATLAQNDVARVFHYRQAGYATGCLFKNGRRFDLVPRGSGPESGVATNPPYVLSGRFVALHGTVSRYDVDDQDVLAVFDLRNRRILRQTNRVWGAGSGDGFGSLVDQLLLKRNGSVAWLSENGRYGVGRIGEVWRMDSRGVRRLDSGQEVVAGSLELNGRSLAWRNGPQSRTASLR